MRWLTLPKIEEGKAGREEPKRAEQRGGEVDDWKRERDTDYTHKSMAALNGTRDDGWPLRLTVS